MIPRLTTGGASFKGAALYYLHDKREEGEDVRATDARVAWTYVLNLPTQDPERAWRMMAHTAMAQAELKAAAGVKATGRKLAKPVMAFSLAWSPDEEPPAPHEMLEAAQEALAALGLDRHQALVVCHRDTAHPHVHVIANRVDPATGIAHTGSRSKLILSEWAEAYERQRGVILCVDRVENNEARREGVRRKHGKRTRPHWQADGVNPEQAAETAERHAAMFGDLAARERAGQQDRLNEVLRFQAERRAGRNAIRDRYQAAADAARNTTLSARQRTLVDALLAADPAIGLQAMTQDRSTFTRDELVRHVGRHTRSVAEFQAVLTRLEQSDELVTVGRDDRGRSRFTTKDHQAIERRMHDLARQLDAAARKEVRPLWPKGIALGRDQDAGLRHVVQARGLASIVGYAGTGKSTLLGAARRSWEAAGLTVHGMTLSGIAADGLKNGSGINSTTIHARLHQWEQGINRPGPRDVIVVDEAGMIGSRQMERILHYAAQGGARVVLVGDPEQLQSIEAGGAFRAIVDRFGAAKLESVRRQKADWQQDATRALATGRTADAIDRYEAAGMVHQHKTADAAKDSVIEGWRKARLAMPAASQIIVTHTRADVRDLNNRARAVLKAAGELRDEVRLPTAEGKRAFAPGDRIYFLKNDAGLGVRNGSLATIQRIQGQSLVVRLDDGRQLAFGIRQYNHIDHGYAATIHKSQGVTVDRAHLFASKGLDRHATYVAMTRHRDRLDLHWSEDSFASRAKLLRTLGRAGVKDTSLDYEAAPGPDDHDARRADRVAAIRVTMRQGFASGQGLKPAKPVGRPGREAAEALRRAAANDPKPPPLRLEGPRPSDRAMVLLTAEMIEFDRETERLLIGLQERQLVRIGEERSARRELTAEAAIGWDDAMTPEEAPAPAPRHQRDADLDDYREQQARHQPGSPKPKL